MKYALLIYGGGGYGALTEAGAEEMYARHEAFAARYGDLLRGGAELRDPDTATSLRHRPEGIVVTDGPFAETTEVLGGFYLVEADDLDQAVEIARHVPALPDDVIEVRPLRGPDDRPA